MLLPDHPGPRVRVRWPLTEKETEGGHLVSVDTIAFSKCWGCGVLPELKPTEFHLEVVYPY